MNNGTSNNNLIKCKNDCLFIMAKQPFDYFGYKQEGYSVVEPYKEKNIITRILREIFFLFNIQRPWFNKHIKQYDAKYVIVKDPLITKDFLIWLHKVFPASKLIFCYDNMVGKAKHLLPCQIPNYYTIKTYDKHDSDNYNLELVTKFSYSKKYVKKAREKKYDVLFVGADKGRLNYLLKLEKQLNDLGLKTKFVVTPNGRFAKRNLHYHKTVPYEQICLWIAESKAILNVAFTDQQGITMRDIESVFNQVKLITTNKHVIKTEIYHPNNVFVLNDSNINQILEFMRKPYIKLFEKPAERFAMDTYIEELVN